MHSPKTSGIMAYSKELTPLTSLSQSSCKYDFKNFQKHTSHFRFWDGPLFSFPAAFGSFRRHIRNSTVVFSSVRRKGPRIFDCWIR